MTAGDKIDFTARGNAVGFTAAGETVCGQRRTKAKCWTVFVVPSSGCMVSMQFDPRTSSFATKTEAVAYARTLIDQAKTEELMWW